MKKVYLFFVLSVVSVVLLTSSCTDVEKEIIGTWEYKDVKLTNLDEIVKNMKDKHGFGEEEITYFKENMVDFFEGENVYIGETIEFAEDGTFINHEGTTEKWSYDKKENKITFVADYGIYTFFVKKISGDTMEVLGEFQEELIEIKLKFKFQRAK